MPAYYQPQGISLGYGCVFFDIVVHELGHALGFYHEHTRPDRDEHVEVIYNNILDGYKDQFSRFSEGGTNTLGIGYDAASIMHYSSDTFTRNGMDTIRARDPAIPFGDAQELSPLDIAKANALYNCGEFILLLLRLHITFFILLQRPSLVVQVSKHGHVSLTILHT